MWTETRRGPGIERTKIWADQHHAVQDPSGPGIERPKPSSGPRFAHQIQTPKVIKSGPQIWAILGPQAGRPATDQTAGPPPGQRVGEPTRPPAAHLAASRSANQPPSWPACAPGVCCLLASGIKIVQTFDRCLLEFARRILAALHMKLSSFLALYCLPQCRAVRKDLWPPWF